MKHVKLCRQVYVGLLTEKYLPKCIDIGLLGVGVEIFILLHLRVRTKPPHNLRSKIVDLCAGREGTTVTTLPEGGGGGG